MQDTKDRGQRAIVGTPPTMDSPPPEGSVAADAMRWHRRHFLRNFCVLAPGFLLWHGIVHLIIGALRGRWDPAWSWPREAVSAAIAAAVATAVMTWLSSPRRK